MWVFLAFGYQLVWAARYILSNTDSVERRLVCLEGGWRTACKDLVVVLGILLTAAAIAAWVTVVIEWMPAAHSNTNTKLSAEFSSDLARNSERAPAVVATATPAAATFLLESPFAARERVAFSTGACGFGGVATKPSIRLYSG